MVKKKIAKTANCQFTISFTVNQSRRITRSTKIELFLQRRPYSRCPEPFTRRHFLPVGIKVDRIKPTDTLLSKMLWGGSILPHWSFRVRLSMGARGLIFRFHGPYQAFKSGPAYFTIGYGIARKACMHYHPIVLRPLQLFSTEGRHVSVEVLVYIWIAFSAYRILSASL